MEQTSAPSNLAKLWEAAIRSAAGPLSAILTPEAYGVSVLRVSNGAPQSVDPFEADVTARISLGCAIHCLDLLLAFERELTSSYRHEVHLSSAVIDGKIIVPRLVALRANGDRTQIPTTKARRKWITPENLLASEMILISVRILRYWKGRGGAEATLASRLLLDFQRLASRRPWSELASYPRETLSVLAVLVQGRTKSGWNHPEATINTIAQLAIGRSPGAALQLAAGPLSFLASQDDRFADKLFELLCLGWFYQIAKADLGDLKVDPKAMRSGKRALLSAKLADLALDLHYQHHFGRRTSWTWEESGKKLEAIPDIVCTARAVEGDRVFLIDAKNRSAASESEVAYKLLGYKENLGLKPYFALAIFPEHERSNIVIKSLNNGENRIVLARIPLLISEARLRVFGRKIWQQLKL